MPALIPPPLRGPVRRSLGEGGRQGGGTYFLSLGSNLGDRAERLQFGLEQLGAVGSVVRISSLYETAPVGNPDQPDFLNAAVEFESALTPDLLLDRIKAIEAAAGRDLKAARWSPRPLDIDILLHGDSQVCTPRLTLPHPRLLEREFALAPMAEIAPDARMPGLEKSFGRLWEEWKSAHPVSTVRIWLAAQAE